MPGGVVLRPLCRLAPPLRSPFGGPPSRAPSNSRALHQFRVQPPTILPGFQSLKVTLYGTHLSQWNQARGRPFVVEGSSSGLSHTAGMQCGMGAHSMTQHVSGGRKGRSQGLRCSAAEAEQREGGGQHVKWEKGGGLVHSLARVDASAVVEVGALVHEHAHVGPHTHVLSGCIVGPNVSVGASSTLGYNVVLQNCSVGDSCILHSGVCVGQDGFGFLVNDAGEMVKKPQMFMFDTKMSRLEVSAKGEAVWMSGQEVGAQLMVRVGSWRDTVIGDHTKIDNLVQIGHNVVVGRCCMLCGQVGLGGSSSIGDYVVLGGKAGVSDHVSVVSKVRIGAKSGVVQNIEEPGDYAGFPAVPAREWRRSVVSFRKLGRSAFVNAPDVDAAGGQ